MPTPTTLAECREAYAADVMPHLPTHVRVRLHRAFMQGAISALKLQSAGVGVDQLLSECIAFGRVVGTPAESRSLTPAEGLSHELSAIWNQPDQVRSPQL